MKKLTTLILIAISLTLKAQIVKNPDDIILTKVYYDNIDACMKYWKSMDDYGKDTTPIRKGDNHEYEDDHFHWHKMICDFRWIDKHNIYGKSPDGWKIYYIWDLKPEDRWVYIVHGCFTEHKYKDLKDGEEYRNHDNYTGTPFIKGQDKNNPYIYKIVNENGKPKTVIMKDETVYKEYREDY